MGKPLSKPDCLRQNPSCVGKGADDEDLNIDDCYVPQRSIYDTVRLNEQIDSSSKGSLSSRHLAGTLPYTQRTLDLSSLCGNGALSTSSSFELRARNAAAAAPEERVFDGLRRLNGHAVRVSDTVLPRSRHQGGDRKEQSHHRRSWRTFTPATGSFSSGSVERASLVDGGRPGLSVASSLTSEDDSGLYSPTADRERHAHRRSRRVAHGTRSLSSSEAMHRSLSSGQEDFLFSPARDDRSFCRSSSLIREPQRSTSGSMDLKTKEGLRNGEYKYSTGRLSSRSTQHDWRSRTLTDYEELSTAELQEDPSRPGSCELVSVVVTQPETYGKSATLPAGGCQLTQQPHASHRVGAADFSMEELEEFLRSVEACLPESFDAFQQADRREIEALLNAITVCPETGYNSPQVPWNHICFAPWLSTCL